jgi:glycine hydroxymethyltransferase
MTVLGGLAAAAVVASSVAEFSSTSYSVQIRRIVGKHQKWRAEECLNLIPSENLTSHTVRQLLSGDMGHRYRADDEFYKGSRYMDQLEALGEQLACEVFGSDWASLRPLSGHMADMIMVSTLTKPRGSILTVSPDDGGYPGIGNQRGYPTFVNVQNLYFPFDSDRMNIDVEKARALIEDEKPSLVVFGQSFFLFPHPVQELADVCREVGSRVCFDGSHVMGLIAGGEFQKPLEEGAELLLGSTHKSLFGPQGGMILGRSSAEADVKKRLFPGLVDNAHWNRIAALVWALDEARRVGGKYARQVIANARALAKSLHEGGVPVKCSDHGFTASHQVFLDIKDTKEIEDFSQRLEDANLIVDHGIRLGTCEASRRGMKPEDLERVAELIVRVYKGEAPERVRREATKVRRQFNRIFYT